MRGWPMRSSSGSVRGAARHDVTVDLERDVDSGVLAGVGERLDVGQEGDSFSSWLEWPPMAVFMTGRP